VKFIIDLDGPVLAVRQRYLHAYTHAAERVQVAPLPDDTFWRLLRNGAADGRLLKAARPEQARKFRTRMEELLEETEAIALCTEAPGAGDALRRLRRFGELILVTTGSNRFARQSVLDRHDLSVHFARMRGLSAESSLRVAQLTELVDEDTRVLIVAGDEVLVRTAQKAGLVTIGVSNGATGDTILTRAGAQLVYPDLGKLADELESGGEHLLQAGLLPQHSAPPRSPFLEPAHLSSGYRAGYRS
jgi:phosphoglycolate phosphatase-like HAD superfamily hydrolase